MTTKRKKIKNKRLTGNKSNLNSDLINEDPTEEQKRWIKDQMPRVEIVKNKTNGNGKKPEEIVHKYSTKGQGPLREATFIDGIPYFIKKSFIENRSEDIITVDPYIEERTKKLRPPFQEECPYIPYEFKTVEEPSLYLQRAKKETIDSLYQKIKSLARLFNDIDEYTLILLAADILVSNFQDRCSTVHYLFVLGDNGTGKSVFGDTFECLGYRAVNITNATEAFWFRVFGTNEAGQVTVIAEEFDKIDEKSQVMGMLKEGYHPNAKVPRMNNENTKVDFFLPFGFKIMIAERSPNADKAKGLLDRSLPVKTYKGLPDYDIKEVRNPQGNRERQQLLDQIMDLRKLLLVFKLLHFKDPLPEVDVGLDGRDKELCKPLLQLFYGLSASRETLNEIEKALKHFLDIKNNRKDDSNEALVYPIIANFVSEHGNELSTTAVWQRITGSLEGYFDKYVDKEGNEYIKNPNVFNTSDYGKLYRNSIIQMIRDKFGVDMKHRKTGNILVFDPSHLAKAGKIYGKVEGIQTKLVAIHDDDYDIVGKGAKGDAGDAGDALLGDISHSFNAPKVSTESKYNSNSLTKVDNHIRKGGKSEEENGLPLRKSESPQSPQSPHISNRDTSIGLAKIESTDQNKICALNSDFPPSCYFCSNNGYVTKKEYENHIIMKHKGKPAFPGLADIKKFGLEPQYMSWEI